MRVLFLHANQQDYLADSLFHGLRQLLGQDCVDYPRHDILYRPLGEQLRAKLRGHGFTLYGLLEDDPEIVSRRYFWQNSLNEFDLFVIANIWSQFSQYLELTRLVDPSRIAVLDGLDVPSCFPYAWRLRRTPWAFLAQVKRSHYFKRELSGEGLGHGLGRLLPQQLRKFLPPPSYAQPIAFAIPQEKITYVGLKEKSQIYNRDVIDPEFGSDRKGELYPFLMESDYYSDLQKSRFGITTKRAGWDCLRHYEMAANGCVLAFRDLQSKPFTCAPHGLNESNCLHYRHREDLEQQIRAISTERYLSLLKGSYKWIEQQTTLVRAREFLDLCSRSR